MHILNIIYNKVLGGLEQVFLDYCDMQLSAGHQLSAIVAPGALITNHIEQRNINYIATHFISSSIGHYNPVSVIMMRYYLGKINPDCIILHNPRPLKLIQKVARCPVIVVNHGTKTHKFQSAKHIICVAKYMIDELKQIGFSEEQLHYVPNNIKINPKPKQRNPFACNETFKIGAIGRLSPEKGFDVLIQALKKINIPYQAIIAGDGPQYKKLQKTARRMNVEFRGWIAGADKQGFFDEIDILCIPSNKESFGVVALEAMNNAIALVSTKTKGCAEIISDGKDGLLANIADPDDIAAKIVKLMQDQNLYNKLASGGYKTIKQHYNHSKIAKQLLAVIDTATK